jgi:hypothetical protein
VDVTPLENVPAVFHGPNQSLESGIICQVTDALNLRIRRHPERNQMLRLVALGTPHRTLRRAAVRICSFSRRTGVRYEPREVPFPSRIPQIQRDAGRALRPVGSHLSPGGCCPRHRREEGEGAGATQREEDGTDDVSSFFTGQTACISKVSSC